MLNKKEKFQGMKETSSKKEQEQEQQTIKMTDSNYVLQKIIITNNDKISASFLKSLNNEKYSNR